MDLTLILWIAALAVLLLMDWRRQWGGAVRIMLVLMALVQLWFGQGLLTNAVRSAMLASRDQRVTTLGRIDSVKLDDYGSGVMTLAQAIGRQSEARRLDRMIAMGVLVWLAISPIIPRRRARVAAEPDKNIPGAAA